MPEPGPYAPVLVTGADGLVGRAFTAAAHAAGLPVLPLGHAELDITDAAAVDRRVRELSPRVVLNAAAYNDNDRAELEPERAFAVNRDGPAQLADACDRTGAWLVHLSSDSVFGDIETVAGHREDAAPSPVSVYASSKLAGEEEVRARASRHVVLRLTWQFGPGDRSFVGAVTRRAMHDTEVRIATGQIGCPTPVTRTAEALLSLLAMIDSRRCVAGVYHFCSDGPVTRMQLAELIVQTLRRTATPRVERLVAVPAATLDRARRPRCSVLDCAGFSRLTGLPRPPWRAELAQTVREIAATVDPR